MGVDFTAEISDQGKQALAKLQQEQRQRDEELAARVAGIGMPAAPEPVVPPAVARHRGEVAPDSERDRRTERRERTERTERTTERTESIDRTQRVADIEHDAVSEATSASRETVADVPKRRPRQPAPEVAPKGTSAHQELTGLASNRSTPKRRDRQR